MWKAVYFDADPGPRALASLADLTSPAESESGILWLDLHSPGAEEIAELSDVFRLDPLIIEDYLAELHPPKADAYDHLLFLVVHWPKAAGARVLTSSLPRKGASMEDGLRATRHATILYLDGDLAGLSEDLVDRMTVPILQGGADFLKARFVRRAGRVRILTAKPLLRAYLPELAIIEQPLVGIIAMRRELLERVRFENDYGLDVGLLIDAAAIGARITDVDIGSAEILAAHKLRTTFSLAGVVVGVASPW